MNLWISRDLSGWCWFLKFHHKLLTMNTKWMYCYSEKKKILWACGTKSNGENEKQQQNATPKLCHSTFNPTRLVSLPSSSPIALLFFPSSHTLSTSRIIPFLTRHPKPGHLCVTFPQSLPKSKILAEKKTFFKKIVSLRDGIWNCPRIIGWSP